MKALKIPKSYMEASAKYPCKFCEAVFQQDFNLKIHLHTAHTGDSSDSDIMKAQDEVSSMKLEGCVYQCKPCGNKFTVAQSFRRHIKDHHGLGITEYRGQHGDYEIVTNHFTCKLCLKHVKQTRNLIMQHLRQVHQISWRQYLEQCTSKVMEAPQAKIKLSMQALQELCKSWQAAFKQIPQD